jgi:Fe-S cluster biogenesis protein NfuA
MKEKIEKAIGKIRPALMADGGNIELVDIVDGVVRVKLMGACSGCPHAALTLKQGVERAIRSEVPEVKGVEAVE